VKEKQADVQDEIGVVRKQTEENQQILTEGAGYKGQYSNSGLRKLQMPDDNPSDSDGKATDPDDPLKGRFGGTPRNGLCELTSEIRFVRGTIYRVTLITRSIDPAKPIVGGLVTYHLHPTFHQPIRKVPIVNGEARLEVLAFGAFTVGAVVEPTGGSNCMLELDLMDCKVDPPEMAEDFRSR
jgi:hypothetical protein